MAKKRLSRWFNLRGWVDYDRLASNAGGMRDSLKVLFIPKKSTRTENLDTAMQRLSLSEEDIKIKQHAFLRLAITMTITAFGILAYCIFHLFNENIMAAIISLILSLVSFTLAFRYHFWHFQLKQRQLGCSFKAWFKHSFLGGK